MDNEIVSRRRLIFILVGASVVVFIGLVWLIAAIRPWDLLGLELPTQTASRQVVRDCTRPITYWKAHPELYPAQVFIGGVAYQETELEALLSDDSQDLSQQLKAQLVVAFLNNQAGADQGSIEATVFDAYGWLLQHPAGSQPTEVDIAQGKQLYDALEAYNLGLAGVAPCAAGPSVTKTVIPSFTASVLSTLSATEFTPAVPSETPSPTTPPGMPTATFAIPTRTAIPTTQVPSLPSRTPTPKAPPPTFTSTPQPPTPTNTPVPPTSTFTPPPAPTDTFTPAP